MSEIIGLETWLYELFHADNGVGGVDTLVAGRIYTDEAPQGSAYPMVLISGQSAIDVVSIGPHRVMVDCLYWIRVIGTGASKKALQTIYDRLDLLLQGAGGITASIRVLMVNREQAIVGIPPATVNGVRYSQLGGSYRAFVQAP